MFENLFTAHENTQIESAVFFFFGVFFVQGGLPSDFILSPMVFCRVAAEKVFPTSS